METKSINVYSFSELNDTAKKKAIETERNTMELMLDFFNDNSKEQIVNAGFTGKIGLQYSLSYSQGDGLSFSAEGFNILPILTAILGTQKQATAKVIAEHLTIQIKGNTGRYCFASKNDVDVYLDAQYSRGKNTYVNIEAVIQKALETLENEYVTLCKKLETEGYKDIEHQHSDEYISENLEANEIQFTEDGKIYNY